MTSSAYPVTGPNLFPAAGLKLEEPALKPHSLCVLRVCRGLAEAGLSTCKRLKALNLELAAGQHKLHWLALSGGHEARLLRIHMGSASAAFSSIA